MKTTQAQAACAQAREQMAAFIDGVLEQAQHEQISAHLTECAVCQEWLDEDSVLEQELPRAFAARPAIPFAWWKTVLTAAGAAAAAVVLTLQFAGSEPSAAVPQPFDAVVAGALQEVGVGSFDDATREDLEAEVGRLLAENAGLRLMARAGGQDSADTIDPDTLVQAVAFEAQTEGQQRQWRSARAAAQALAGREAAGAGAIERHLLGAKDNAQRRLAGLRLCRILPLPQGTQRILPFLNDASPEVSREAVEALGAQRDLQAHEALQAVFANSTDARMKVSAAGGLVRQGDHGAPLEYLQRRHRAPGLGRRERAEALARVMLAPLARSDTFLVGVLVAPDTDSETREALVEMLGQLGTPAARAILEHVEMAPVDAELKRLARKALEL